MKYLKSLLLFFFVSIGSIIFVSPVFASYDITGATITGSTIHWTNSLSGSCTTSASYSAPGGSPNGAGGYQNDSCSTLQSSGTDLELTTIGGVHNSTYTYAFTINNYSGGGAGVSNPLPIYWTGTNWSLTQPVNYVYISIPISGTTETDITTTITVNWVNVDRTSWQNILLNFSQHITGVSGSPNTYAINTDSGSFNLTLANMGFTQNGQWDAYLGFQGSTFQSLNQATSYNLVINFADLPSAPVSLTETCSDITIAGGSIDLGTWADIPCQIHNAVAWVFTENPSELQSLFLRLKTDILNLWPIGYITRFVVILSSPTQIEPPALSYTMGSVITNATGLTGTYTFQVFDHLGVLTTIKEDTNSGTRDIWDIFMPYWDTMVYLSLFIVIITTLMSSHLGHILDKTQHNTHKSDDGGKKGQYDNLKHYTS